jgi:hypothetical protein
MVWCYLVSVYGRAAYAAPPLLSKPNRQETDMKLNVKALAITLALVWGVGLFIMTWWIILLNGVTGDVTFIGRVYRGYSITPLGSFIGLIWALVDGAVTGAIFAWIYNWFASRTQAKEA